MQTSVSAERRRRLLRRGGGPQWIVWTQQCLRQVIGSSVPQSGVLGKATRRAIRLFQKRERLPVTGLFDDATEAALRTACSGQGSVSSRSAAPSGATSRPDDAEPVAGPGRRRLPKQEQIPGTAAVASQTQSRQGETMARFPLNHTKRNPNRKFRPRQNVECELSAIRRCLSQRGKT